MEDNLNAYEVRVTNEADDNDFETRIVVAGDIESAIQIAAEEW